MPDTPADVVLMTIHQAKGLEWDAVAVVSMQSGVFPSNQGGLHVELDAEHPAAVRRIVDSPGIQGDGSFMGGRPGRGTCARARRRRYPATFPARRESG